MDVTICKTAFEGDPDIFFDFNPVTDKHICIQCYQFEYGYCGCQLTDITDQQKVERKKLEISLRNSSLYIWEFDISSRRFIQQYDSVRALDLPTVVENAPESVIADGWIHPDSVENYRKLHEAVIQGEKNVSADICFVDSNGDATWQRCTYTTIFAEGKPVSAVGCNVDINEAKQMEHRFREEVAYIEATQSMDLLVKARSNITNNIVESYIADKNIRVTSEGMPYDTSIDLLAASGFTKEERNNIHAVLNRKHLLKAFSKGETQHTIEYRRKDINGTMIWVSTTFKLYSDPETDDVMSFLYTYDINDQRIKDGIIETVTALEYDYIAYINLQNDRYQLYKGGEDVKKLLSAQTDDYTASVYDVNSALVSPEDRERAISDMLPDGIRKNLENRQVYSTVYSVFDEDGNVRQKQIQYAYLDKDSEQIVLTRTDVTILLDRQKQQQSTLETALLAAQQANSAKSDFLSRMSHEIRTPMNAIIGMTAIAAQSVGDDAQVADCISKIGISSRFLLSLINDILDMSRIESGKVLLKSEKIPFEEFLNGINTICYNQANSKDIDYENIVDANLEDYYIGDAMKLQQVLVNVLSNAVKFTPRGGKVSFDARQIKKNKTGATIRFTVNDTGCGISEKFIPHLFEPFSQEHSGNTTMYGGTGLGLAICKNLVDMMNGNIQVRSIIGAGSEFVIDVDLGITEESKTRYINKPNYNFSQLKTLVVDDDVTVCEQAIITLNEIGISAQWVDSGRKAVSTVKEKWAEKKYYDMILIDWKMPEMDGIETARQIRKIVGPDVTIIIMTAYDWAAIEQEAKLAGVNLLMSKPMFKSSLISTFEKALGKQIEESTIIKQDFRFENKRILLAEDHPLNTEVAVRLLERKGFAVEHAENGLRALEMFTTNPSGYYDAILMDIRMPHMDGLQAAKAIRHLSKSDAEAIPIIAMTANAFEDDVQKSRAAGMNAHLAKPIDPEHMYQTLFDFIYEKGND